MNSFLPSEISRLTYGYLRKHCDQNLADEFSKSCPSMKECRQMKLRYGRNFHSTVQDLTLEMILDQYSRLCSLIFMCFDEDKRVHRNVLDLLQMILKKNEPEQSTCQVNTRVFKDVQNVPSNRNVSVSQFLEARGQENKHLAPESTEMSGDEYTRMSTSKRKTASPIHLSNRKPAVTNKLLSDTESNVAPDGGGEISHNISPGVDHSSDLLQDQAVAAKTNTSETRSNVSTPSHFLSQKSILHLSENIQPEEIDQSFNPFLTRSSGKTNLNNSITVSKEIVEKIACHERVSSSPESVLPKIGTVDFGNSNELVNSSHLKPSLETQSPALAYTDETCVFEENETVKLSYGTINSPVNPISLPESVDIVSSSHSVLPSSSVKADWKAIFCNSSKIPTPPKRTSQKIPESETKTTSTSAETPSETIKKAVPPQECIQVFFENLSKGFKHRSHPYVSPARSKELLHQAALSPLSKMYVTPTKPNIPNSTAINHSVGSNAASTSSISSSQRSIFSPVSIDSPCEKKMSARKEPKQDNAGKKRSSKRVASPEEKVSAKRKKSHRQESQLSGGVNDEIQQKLNKISSTKNSRINTALDSRSTKNSKKEAAGCKNVQQVLAQDLDPAEGNENKKTLKIKKDLRLSISSSQKSISKSQNELNDRGNELNFHKENKNDIVPKSIQTLNIEEMFRKMVLRVFVKETCEIAELDVSSEFLLHHRNSA